ncbi:MAG: hypothetical protein AB7P02_15540 [Alphaproteobacteria bacterium]
MQKAVKSSAANRELTEADVEAFRVAAIEFNRKATQSPAAALKVLHALGTHTKSGKISAKYR